MFGLGFLWFLVRAFRVLLRHFVGIVGHFAFGRAFRRFGWAFRVLPSISWILVGFSCFAEAFRGYWWAFRVWPSIS